ncbi:hypothetical protein GCM10017744_036280 [Streptomyces antimycoticus]|uniref:Uncharacterized protein n=1 Tax=Streptomyces antimycoticus TaxID=68175 RepID=A0A4D4KG39_9ACTN|nr:hypothetical protein SANT12839_066320 [Streptomyces antimycoticus]
MSKIHSCWVELGCSSRLMAGTAKYSTDTSMETRRSGSIRTTKAVHSVRPARGPVEIEAEVEVEVEVMAVNIRAY